MAQEDKKQEEKQETRSKNVSRLKDCGKLEVKLYKYKDFDFLLPSDIQIYQVVEDTYYFFISDTIKVNGDSSLVYGYCWAGGFSDRDPTFLLERKIYGLFRGDIKCFDKTISTPYDEHSMNYYQDEWLARNGEREKEWDDEMDMLRWHTEETWLKSPEYYAKLMDKQRTDLKALEGNPEQNDI